MLNPEKKLIYEHNNIITSLPQLVFCSKVDDATCMATSILLERSLGKENPRLASSCIIISQDFISSLEFPNILFNSLEENHSAQFLRTKDEKKDNDSNKLF